MGLHSVFESLLGRDEPLPSVDDVLWQQLSLAAKSPRHAWHQASLGTLQNGRCYQRMVVVRKACAADRLVDCHTDPRSDKVSQIEVCPGIEWLFWDPKSRIQCRLGGTASVLRDGPEVDVAWRATSPQSRGAYRSERSPGTAIDDDHPPPTDDRQPRGDDDPRGREHFAIFRTIITRVDGLYLRREGHVRFGIHYDDAGRCIDASWLVP